MVYEQVSDEWIDVAISFNTLDGRYEHLSITSETGGLRISENLGAIRLDNERKMDSTGTPFVDGTVISLDSQNQWITAAEGQVTQGEIILRRRSSLKTRLADANGGRFIPSLISAGFVQR